MVFSSLPFLFFFLPLFLILYMVFPGRAKNAVLLIFSLVFYAWGEPVYILLMLLSSFVDYIDGLLQERFAGSVAKKRACLITALFINLSLLAYFKYAGFFAGMLNHLVGGGIPVPEVALPVGISFYTFQTVSYSIDVYRGTVRAERNYFRYLTYVSMFPQLIAGPIVRFSSVQKELGGRTTDEYGFVTGFRRFLTGLFRKVLIADRMGLAWDGIRSFSNISPACAWLGLLCFTLQLYFDFSAYSDMAIGLGRMLGFHFPENFVYPLSSLSITDFWRRWHVSLSTWFRDYVYIPLGGNRVGVIRHLLNMFAVWFLTGLWHGASWNFVLWGLWHGTFLALEKYVWGGLVEKLPGFFRHLYAIVLVILGFGIFYFEDMGELGAYFYRLIPHGDGPVLGTDLLWIVREHFPVLVTAILLAFPVYPAFRKWLEGKKGAVRIALDTAGIALTLLFFAVVTASLVRDTYNPFLYFRF